MTAEDKAKLSQEEYIFLLEDALMQAQWTTRFLHDCLKTPGFSYAYPEQTLQRLEEWGKLVATPPLCHHSRTEHGCEACQIGQEHRRRLYEIRKKLEA